MIRQDQEIFNILLETVSEAVVIVNQNQRIVEVNRSAEVIFGYDNSEIRGKPLEILMPSNYHDSHKEHFKWPNHSMSTGFQNWERLFQ